MMLFQWMNKKVGQFKWYDIAFIEVACMAFALMLAKLWHPLLSLSWITYAVIMVVFAIVPLFNMFKSQQ